MSSLRGRFDPSLGIRSPWNLRGFGAVNKAPTADDATLSIAENNIGTIGTVAASDPDGDTLTYSITAGDPSDKFSINASSGVLVATGSGLDYETDTQHVLTITVSDSVLTGTATITVNVTNLNEAPVAIDNTFSINENAAITALGTIAASDVDAGTTLTYSITAGNGAGKFSIHASDGVLSTTGALDHETTAQYVLTVTVSDSALTDTATVTVDVNDVNEAPVAVDNTFTIAENAGASTLGTVAASDVDDDTLTWSITAGNGSSLFSINTGNGSLSTTGDLDYETAAQHVLTITVTDDGTGTLSDTATVTVDVTDVAESSGPTNEFVFSGVTGANPQSCLTMSSSDFGAWDRTNFGILVRAFPDFDGYFTRVMWSQQGSGTDASFYVYFAGNKIIYFVVRGAAGQKYASAYDDGSATPTEQEYLLYFTYTEDGTSGDFYIRIYVSSDDNTPTEMASVLNNLHPIYVSTSDMILGAYSTTAYGMKGTIHQPIFFSGGTIPTHEEIGTADTPLAGLSSHASAWSAPDADDLPNDEILSTAWTNNNSVGVQTH